MDIKRIVVAITGATGAIYGVRILKVLRDYPNVETHLILSKWANETIELETNYSVTEVKDLADFYHDNHNLGAHVASGSFQTSGMVIIPCSMKTLAAVAHGLADNLVVRTADVMLKERKKLIIVPRETPLSIIHLENMLSVSKAGACLVPPMPAFYNHPSTIDDIVNHLVARVIDQFGLQNQLTRRWGEVTLTTPQAM